MSGIFLRSCPRARLAISTVVLSPVASARSIAIPDTPKTSLSTSICTLARKLVVDYQAALPASAVGADVANRLGEQKARVETFLHVWDTRFLPSIKNAGYCREKGTCPP